MAAQHFYPTDRIGYVWEVLPGQEVCILPDFASIAIALAEGEMPDLPELSVLVDEVRLPDEARVIYNDMERKLFAELEGHDILAVSQAVATGKLAQMANGFVYGEGGNTDVVAAHREGRMASRPGRPPRRRAVHPGLRIPRRPCHAASPVWRRLLIWAPASATSTLAACDAWNRGELPLFALHPASGGHGLNLQRGGSRMAWISPTWSAELWDQTIARIHRPGQDHHGMVHVCVATDTVDDLKRLRVISGSFPPSRLSSATFRRPRRLGLLESRPHVARQQLPELDLAAGVVMHRQGKAERRVHLAAADPVHIRAGDAERVAEILVDDLLLGHPGGEIQCGIPSVDVSHCLVHRNF